MRPVQGEAGEGTISAGASRSSRGGQTWAWRHSAPVCLLSPCGMVAGNPLGWGGGPSHVWALPRPLPGDPESVSQRQQSFPLWDPWVGRMGFQGPRPNYRTAKLSSGGGGEARTSGPWGPGPPLSSPLYQLVGSLTLFFSVSG